MLRADDVFVDNDVSQFEKICQIVRRYDFDHIVGITPKGEGKWLWSRHKKLWKIHFLTGYGIFVNYRIKRNCGEKFIGKNIQLVRLLNSIFKNCDTVPALHGLHHYRYTDLPQNIVCAELSEGIELLKQLLGVRIKVFTPPFCSWNHCTERACENLKLTIDKCAPSASFDNLIRNMNDWQIIQLAKEQSSIPELFYHPWALQSLRKFEIYLKTRRKYL